MFHYIVLTASITLCLVVGFLLHRIKPQAKHKPQRRWMRCALCGGYQNTSYNYCVNHERPVFMLEASERQQRRIRYHLGYIWQYPHLKRQQHDFIAFTMRLEDMTEDAWTTNAAISVYETVGPCYLQKFVEFMLALEESVGKRLDTNDIIEQFLVSERMEDEQEKITQN